jgi:hypothetical protein
MKSASNVTPRSTIAAINPRGRQLLIAVIALVVIVLLVRSVFGHHENRYEQLAHDVTVALQNNDLDAVRKYQNAETATLINRGIVGRAADRLAPLGKIKSVKEVTPSDGPKRVHEFNVAFDKGMVHEKMKVDPDFKIVHFEYDRVPQ